MNGRHDCSRINSSKRFALINLPNERSCVSRQLKKIWLVTQAVACIKCENLGVPMSRTANHIVWTFGAIG